MMSRFCIIDVDILWILTCWNAALNNKKPGQDLSML